MNDDICYSALQSRDARFDGAFFVGVTSTGIYCRPICKVRIPKRENCRFFTHAAVAEGLGFRACLRCRPSLAPPIAAMRWSNEDASQTLAHQALQLIDQSKGGLSVLAIAQKMGISDRHLRRIFAAYFGVSPLTYLTAIKDVHPSKPLMVKLPFHAPYDHAQVLAFFAKRTIKGVEQVDDQNHLWRTLRLSVNRKTYSGWVCADFTSHSTSTTLPITISASLVPALSSLVPLLRATFDLDAHPLAIDALLLQDFPNTGGQRVPGCFDGFELAVRAVLGQQITVQAARTLTERLVAKFGEPLKVPLKTLSPNTPPVDRLFPSASKIARTTAADLGELGIVKQRQSAILGLAEAVQNGLDLSGKSRTAAQLEETRQQLCAIKGIGAWTAAYIAMRALRDPDSFPAGDVALQNVLGVRGDSALRSAKAAQAQSEKWQPWRSYAVIRTWTKNKELFKDLKASL